MNNHTRPLSKFETAICLYRAYLLTESLNKNGGNISATAADWGLHRNSVQRMIKSYGIKLTENGNQNKRVASASITSQRAA